MTNRVRAKNFFTVQFQDKTEHSVGSGMLGTAIYVRKFLQQHQSVYIPEVDYSTYLTWIRQTRSSAIKCAAYP